MVQLSKESTDFLLIGTATGEMFTMPRIHTRYCMFTNVSRPLGCIELSMFDRSLKHAELRGIRTSRHVIRAQNQRE